MCGGAFDGLEKVIARRLNTHAIGYSSKKDDSVDKENLLQYVTPPDIKKYGIIPELIGRLPVLTHLDPLDKTALRRILTEPKNSLIKQYTSLFEMDGISLSFNEAVFNFIVDKAMEFKLGARGLRSICEAIMLDAMFELPSDSKTKEVKIDLSYAKEKLKKSTIRKLKVA